MNNAQLEDIQTMQPWCKRVECPHCHEQISVDFSVNINTVSDWKKDKTTIKPILDEKFHEHEIRIIDEADKTGILEAFAEAATQSNPGNAPFKDIRRFFLHFLKTAVPKRVPAFVVEAYTQEFPGRLWFHASCGVISVTSDGKLCAFLPQRMAVGAKIGKLGKKGSGVARLPADEERFEEWIRTKHGYVVGRGAYFEADDVLEGLTALLDRDGHLGGVRE